MSSARECPKCGGQSRVLETRDDLEDAKTIRRRMCRKCGHRFSTVEQKARRISAWVPNA